MTSKRCANSGMRHSIGSPNLWRSTMTPIDARRRGRIHPHLCPAGTGAATPWLYVWGEEEACGYQPVRRGRQEVRSATARRNAMMAVGNLLGEWKPLRVESLASAGSQAIAPP